MLEFKINHRPIKAFSTSYYTSYYTIQIKARERFVCLLLNMSQSTDYVMSGRHRVSGLHLMLTSIRNWDVMTCEIIFEIWHPSNKEKNIYIWMV